jgi:hypothetical protein
LEYAQDGALALQVAVVSEHDLAQLFPGLRHRRGEAGDSFILGAQVAECLIFRAVAKHRR